MVNTAIVTFRADDGRRRHEPNLRAGVHPRAGEARAAPTPDADRAAPNFINDIAAGKVELPTIPRVVQRLIAALRDPDVDSRKIGEALAQDPVLSAKVLRLANSSFFGGQRSMASIEAAVALIGTQALNKLIVACGVSSSFKDIPGNRPAAPSGATALVAATAAGKLAPRLAADAEEAYVCGLLHATGHLILCQTYPEIADVDVHRLRRRSRRRAGRGRGRGVRHRPRRGRRALGRDHRLPAAGRRHDPQGDAALVRRRRAARRDLAQRLRARRGGRAEGQRRSGARVAAGEDARALRRRRRRPDAAFAKLYEALQETEPKM